MDGDFFKLDNPVEKAVYERLKKYVLSGVNYDQAMDMIGRDFPFLDSSVLDACNTTAFVHYIAGQASKAACTIKHVNVLNSNSLSKPFHSHIGRNFRLKDDEDVMAAVMVENPLYLYENADVHLTFHVDGNKTNEFKHTMDMGDRRNVYYVPLNIRKGVSFDESEAHNVQIFVMNEMIEGQSYGETLDVSLGATDVENAFEVLSFRMFDQNGLRGSEGEFEIEDLRELEVQATLKYDKSLGDLGDPEAIVVFGPCDAVDNRFDLIRPLKLSYEDDGALQGDCTLFGIRKASCPDDEVPNFTPKPGKYSIKVYIWDKLIWTQEICLKGSLAEVTEEENEDFNFVTEEYNRHLLEDLVEELGLEGVENTLFENPFESAPVLEQRTVEEPDIDPLEYIQVLGLSLYNVNNNRDDATVCTSNLSADALTGFNAEKLKMLSVIGKMRSTKTPDILEKICKFSWVLYDQTGRLVDTHPAYKENILNEVWVCAAFGDFCQQNWAKGAYRIELLYNDTNVLSAVFTVGDIDVSSDYDPKLITKKHVTFTDSVEGHSLERLEKMAGLKGVKEKVHSLMSTHKFQMQREKAGLPCQRQALHARFLGNPGTGKTTVARLLGQIYKEMGLLSSGHVVLEERKNLIGRYYDSEGQAVDNALNRAKGGILLIDEAYNLYVESDEKDPGRRVLEYLLTALSDENNRDWMLILAGYPDEMEKMLESNPGIESRVDEKFYFEDLTVDELMQVAELYCDEHKYELSDEAKERLRSVITRDVAQKGKNFGNGRYANKLMDTAINTRMASRIGKIESPTYDQLVTIEADDIPISAEEAKRISSEGFNETAIDEALKRLDSLVGLNKVKSALHNFVNVSRYLQSQGEKIRGKGLLKWNFTGNTGTGKSTVAQILADILKAMNLVHNNELTEVKGEEIFNVSDFECNEVIRAAVKKSRKGVLFIDGDAPEFRSSQYRLTSEQVRFKLASLASEDNASGALIIAECTSSNLSMAHSLAANGIYDFDHTFIFDDYSAEELYDILIQCLDKMKTTMSKEAEVIIREYIGNLCANREMDFANARTMKNLSRAIFETMIIRLCNEGNPDTGRIVMACDVESFVWKKRTGKIGF